MAYKHIDDPDTRPHLDNIEMHNTSYDAGAYGYAPPPGKPSSQATGGDSKHDDDAKPFFQADAKGVPQAGEDWPVQAQQVATVTPLRAFLMVFDGVLASTPIMFVGELFIADLFIWYLV
jgi:hypothetical protein